MHVGAGGVPVRLLVATGRNLRDVCMHRSVREDETDVHRTLAARLELIELEAREVVNEVRLPHVADRTLAHHVVSTMIPLPFEMLRLSEPIGEGERIVEDEIEVVVEIERERRIARAGNARRLHSGIVEQLVPAIERNREQGLRAPFE